MCRISSPPVKSWLYLTLQPTFSAEGRHLLNYLIATVSNEAYEGRVSLMQISAMCNGNFLSYLKYASAPTPAYWLVSATAILFLSYYSGPIPCVTRGTRAYADDVQLLPVGCLHVIACVIRAQR